MKPIATILLLILSTTTIFAQNMNQGGPVRSSFYQQLPYREVNSKIIIEVSIGGHKHQFMLDTGAPNQVEPALANQLHLATGTKHALEDAYNNADSAYIATVPGIKLGDVDFANSPAIIKDLGMFKCYGIDGVIGSNLLRNCILQINSSTKTLVITNDASRLTLNPKNAIALSKKKDNQSSPYIVINVAPHVTGEFLFDTGDLGFIEVSQYYMDIFKKNKAITIMATGYGTHSFGGNGAELSAAKSRIKFANMQIGGGTFTNAITETSMNNDRIGNRVGALLADHGIITVDYLHSKFYFDPFTSTTDLNDKTWSVSPTFNNGRLVIGLVWDKLKDKLTPGQQIIAIDGSNTEQVDICKLLTQKSILNGKEQATLTLRDDNGVVSKVDIVKE